MRRRLECRALGAAALAAVSLSCFEQPVRERLVLKFLPGNAVMVAVSVDLAAEEVFEENRAARERIQALRRDLEQNRDDWARRIASVDPALERTLADRENGKLRSVSRRIVLEHAEDLSRFFSDTLIHAQITRREEEVELTLTPGPGGRASRAQREEFETRQRAWLASYSRYLHATGRLYAYLEEHASSAPVCLASVFAEETEDAKREELGEPTSQEQEMIDAVRQSIEETLSLFSLPEQSPYSLEELSRLVYDPFPAPLTVQLPSPAQQSEGFVDKGNQILEIPARSLWEALGALGDRWVTPDLLLMKYRLAIQRKPVDLPALVSVKRSATASPTPAEIQQALQKQLAPTHLYLVRWSTRNLPELDPSEGRDKLWQIPTPSQD
jgi:hypothetical protein